LLFNRTTDVYEVHRWKSEKMERYVLIRELKVNDAVIRLRALKIKDFQTHQYIELVGMDG